MKREKAVRGRREQECVDGSCDVTEQWEEFMLACEVTITVASASDKVCLHPLCEPLSPDSFYLKAQQPKAMQRNYRAVGGIHRLLPGPECCVTQLRDA